MPRPQPLQYRLERRPVDPWRLLYLLILVSAFVRFAMARVRELVPDEAFYWLLGQHLAAGYLDHPPMLAWLIRLSTMALGKSEFAVRAFMVLMSLGIIGILLRLCTILTNNIRAVWLLAAILVTSPYLAGLGLLATPDTPVAFFSLAALACAVRIAMVIQDAAEDRAPGGKALARLWFFFGLFCGLALLSKYTAILLPLGVYMALLTTRAGRAQFRQPGIYAAGLVTTLVFSPVIYWNATHHWASFAFQLHHGTETAPINHWRNLGEYIGGQFLPLTPILFLLGIVALVHFYITWKRLDLHWRMLVIASTLPPVFFLLAAAVSKGEMNWPAFAYLPMALLIVAFVLEQPSAHKRRGGQIWIGIGCFTAVLATVVLYSPLVLLQAENLIPSTQPHELPKKAVDFYGWRRLGRYLDQSTAPGIPILCATHEDAGEVAFYTTSPHEVWAVSLGPHARPTAFDYFDQPPPWKTTDTVALLNADVAEFCRQYGFEALPVVQQWSVTIGGHLRDRELVECVRSAATQPATAPATGERRPAGGR